jgi:hypothetical protein
MDVGCDDRRKQVRAFTGFHHPSVRAPVENPHRHARAKSFRENALEYVVGLILYMNDLGLLV